MNNIIKKLRPANRILIAFLFALIGFFLIARATHLSISRSSSSTAAVGYIMIPFNAAPLSAILFVFGYCLTDLVNGLKGKITTRSGSAGLRATIAALMLTFGIYSLIHSALLSNAVKQVPAMNGSEINAFIDHSMFRKNVVALNAVTRNPETQAQALDRIVQMPAPTWHQKLGSNNILTGRFYSWEDVMSSIAKHENVSAEALTRLSTILDKYKLRAVALNPKTPIPTLRDLAERGHYNVNIGLGINTNTPIDVLNKLAKNENKHVRKIVAGNINTPVNTLITLSDDDASMVRYFVASNPNTPSATRAILANDPNQQVRASVLSYHQKREKPAN